MDLATSKTKTTTEISREYGMTVQTIRAWSKQYKKSKTFGVRAVLSPLER
ncbi:MAG: terminase gpP N-terminus-related DNA-binding protein [Fusobacteriaceae bacterium]